MAAQKTDGTVMSKKVSLKLVIDKKGKRVLYGEADKEFIDFLFTILALPAGTVIKLLSTDQTTVPGPLSNLYSSIDAMNTINYFDPNRHVQNLLNSKTYYMCNRLPNCRNNNISSTYGAKCTKCSNGTMNINISFVYGAGEARPIEGGYVKGTSKYMVMDDLTVKPMPYSSMSTISVFYELNVEDLSQIEEKLIDFDINKGLKLLKASFYTPTVLTDMFLPQIDFSKHDDNVSNVGVE